jgi:hypothetical protein
LRFSPIECDGVLKTSRRSSSRVGGTTPLLKLPSDLIVTDFWSREEVLVGVLGAKRTAASAWGGRCVLDGVLCEAVVEVLTSDLRDPFGAGVGVLGTGVLEGARASFL